MNRTTKRSLSLVLALLLLGALAPSAFAGTQQYGAPCTGNRWLGYENTTNDSSDGNDRLWVCNFNGPVYGDNLDIQHSLPGTCKAPIIVGDEWNDCLSSVIVYIEDNTKALCLYDGYGYTGASEKFTPFNSGIRYNLTLPSINLNDKVASFKWINNSASC
jgi:hypothetical protein